eukprot:TCALIF_02915-PA protein Name:"Similar to Mgst3 Microsomal glutathione S-transferase 3 (Mus musculus)" AED:0.03 eAED:0.08 QI:199/0.75/0.8/1/0.25/0.4/5/109/152
MHIQLTPDYGYVILAGATSAFMVMWKAIKVGQARKAHNIKYPVMYSTENGGDNVFNCVQDQLSYDFAFKKRSHQNTLEVYPQFLFFLATGGISCPRFCAGAGLLWTISRIVYALGYSTGKPEKRMQGAFGYLGYFGLWGCSIYTGLKMTNLV